MICRDPRTLYIDPNRDGDCFEIPCSMKTGALLVRTADTLIFPATTIYPNSYPSEFSDLFIQLSLMNTTVISKGTIVDGKFLAGDMLFQITSHPEYTWTLFQNWTFRHFSKSIFTRQYTWSTAPFIIFRDCIFENSKADLFAIKGGTYVFENCVFRNISGRSIKAISEVRCDFTGCLFESCQALFFYGSDASFTNCRFIRMYGQRGGAVYTAKTTLYIERCLFINCTAKFKGGALYLRDSLECFETEIKTSCFIDTNANVNGSSIYSYLSSIKLSGKNCFTSDFNQSVCNVGGTINIEETQIVDDKCRACITMPLIDIISIDYSPIDTNKLYQFDDLKPGSMIIVDDEEYDDEI